MELDIQQKGDEIWKRYPYLFNQTKILVFECQCSKRYETFPGLYLHFQRKHKQRISAKLFANQCRQVVTEEKIIYRYNIKSKPSKSLKLDDVNTNDLKLNLSSVFSLFLTDDQTVTEDGLSIKTHLPQIRRSSKFLWNFQEFAMEIVKLQGYRQNIADFLSSLPLHFNSFCTAKSLEMESQEYTQLCQTLYCFGKWLRKKGYTEMHTVYSPTNETKKQED